MKIFGIEIPYWKGKRIMFTLYKSSNGIYRLGVWKLDKLSKEYGGHKGEWGTNWWKFYDIGRGK